MYSETSSIELARHDIDNNKIINIADLMILIDNYGALQKDFNLEDGYQSPDFNGDNIVNSLDYGALIQYLGTEVTTQ